MSKGAAAFKKWADSQPPEGSDQAAKLNQELRMRSLKETTRRQYSTPVGYYLAVSGFPTSGEKLQTFVRALLENGYKSETIRKYVSAIKSENSIRGHNPITGAENSLVSRALSAADRVAPQPPPKRAQVLDQELLSAIKRVNGLMGKDHQVKNVVLITTALVCRLGEVTQLRGEDIEIVTKDCVTTVTITLKDTKMKPIEHVATECDSKGLPCGKDFCVAHTLAALKVEQKSQLARLFPDVSQRTVITDLDKILKISYPSRNYDLSMVSGHSFRRTGASRLKLNEIPEEDIRGAGRWKSQVWQQYTQEVSEKRRRLHADIILK